jgi:hypothetical protein
MDLCTERCYFPFPIFHSPFSIFHRSLAVGRLSFAIGHNVCHMPPYDGPDNVDFCAASRKLTLGVLPLRYQLLAS